MGPLRRPFLMEGDLPESMSEQDHSTKQEGEAVYAVSLPPAMYARDILKSRAFAEAMGYAWLHDEDTEFARSFREQVQRQAELYQEWLNKEE